MGQYNLLHEVIRGTSRFSCFIKTFALEETWMEYKYSSSLELGSSENVKKLLFEEIQKVFKMQPLTRRPPPPPPPPAPVTPPPPKPKPAEPPIQAQILETRRARDEELGFLPEFQELILIWHVATDVFLLMSGQV